MSIIRSVSAPFKNLRTYKHALLFILQLFIGTLYFAVISTGIFTTAGLVMSIIGLPFAIFVGAGTLYISRQLWNLEAWLLGKMYSEQVLVFKHIRGTGLHNGMKTLATDPGSWKALLTGLLRLPIGIMTNTTVVITLSLVAGLVATPFVYGGGWIQIGESTVINTPFEAWSMFIAGVLLLIASAHAIRYSGDILLSLLARDEQR